MSKILSDFPVAHPFPSLGFGVQNTVPKPQEVVTKIPVPKDVFIAPKVKKSISLKKIFNFMLRHK